MEMEVLATTHLEDEENVAPVVTTATTDEDNVNTDADDMLQEHVYNNEDGSVDLAPELNVDENTILLPVAEENGLNADDPAIAFSANDFLQEEEEVVDPMDTNVDDLEMDPMPVKRSQRRTPEVKKTPTQVPKKRRDVLAVTYEAEEESTSPEKKQKRRGRKPGSKVINGQVFYPTDEQGMTFTKNTPKATPVAVKPTTKVGTRSTPKPIKEEPVNDNQCRVCMSSGDLLNVFRKEHTKTYAEKLMALCPGVSIQRKDFLPQFICEICASSVNAAFALKTQCEQTDVELRERLEKSLKKIRRPVSRTIIPPDSEPEDFPDPPQDQDFKLSDATPPSAEDSDSEYGKPLAKRRTRRRTRKTPAAAAAAASITPKIKSERKSKSTSATKKVVKTEPDLSTSKSSVEPDADPAAGGDFSSGSEEDYSPPKKRRGKQFKSDDKDGLICRVCHDILPSREELKIHRKEKHSQHECELCGRKFRVQSSLKAHMEKHTRSGELKCEQCEKHFPNKTERRKHMVEVHNEAPAQFTCEKCKRAFTTEVRLVKHNESRCPGFDMSMNKKRVEMDSLAMGKDLFKCVAPLTTTYWSDSFSD